MRILASIANADAREGFMEVANSLEESEMGFINPHTHSPKQIGAYLREKGYEFLFHDFGPLIPDSEEIVKELREEMPDTPMIVYTLYKESENVIRENKCGCFNGKDNMIWHPEGEALLKKEILGAKKLV